MWIHVCIYTSNHTYMHICIHTYICIYINTYKWIHSGLKSCCHRLENSNIVTISQASVAGSYLKSQVYTYIYIYMYIYIHIWICMTIDLCVRCLEYMSWLFLILIVLKLKNHINPYPLDPLIYIYIYIYRLGRWTSTLLMECLTPLQAKEMFMREQPNLLLPKVHIYIHAHLYKHVYICIYIYMFDLCLSEIHICICIYIKRCLRENSQTFYYKRFFLCMFVCVCEFMHIYNNFGNFAVILL
jgi:hypothetical protein